MLGLTSAPATAHQNNAPHLKTCDGKSVLWHKHRATALLKAAYAGDELPRLKDLVFYHSHKQCIRVESIRKELAALRDRLKGKLLEQLATDQFSDLTPPGEAWLASTRACESGGNYSINTGNGYYGAYQFNLDAWSIAGGSGYPHLASPAEQDYRAAVLYRMMGPSPWPVCGY